MDSESDRECSVSEDENISDGSPNPQGSLHDGKNANGINSSENTGAENISVLPVAAIGSADENPASEGDGQEIAELMDDMIVRDGQENRGRVVDNEEKSNRSSSPAGSLRDIMQEPGQFFDENFPSYLRSVVSNVPSTLRNLGTIKYDIPKKTHGDRRGVIRVPPRHERTMDGAGKCFQIIPSSDLSKYTQPYEAAPWVFVSQ